MSRLSLLSAGLIMLLPASALAAGGVPAQTTGVPELPVGVRSQPLAVGEQTGKVDIPVAAGDTPISIRSVQPDSVNASAYRISFSQLDTDADGFINRDEAAAHPALNDEFKALDGKRRGKLDRNDLAGWLID